MSECKMPVIPAKAGIQLKKRFFYWMTGQARMKILY